MHYITGRERVTFFARSMTGPADDKPQRPAGKPSETVPPALESAQGVILLAEDREDEVMLLRRAFAQANFLNPLHVVSNGEEAIAYLQGEGKYANRAEYPLPTLVLLDLKMPRKDGFEVLHWIRQ